MPNITKNKDFYEELLRLKRGVMRRVYFRYHVSRIASWPTAKLLVAIISLAQLIRYISPTSVIQNAPSIFRVEALSGFIVSAFRNTDIAVYGFTLIALLLGFWFVMDLRTRRAELTFVSTQGLI